jgi:hypothetical protein
MTESQAKEVLYNAVNIAISKGCYNLDESISIVDALRIVLVEARNNRNIRNRIVFNCMKKMEDIIESMKQFIEIAFYITIGAAVRVMHFAT